MGGHQNGPHGAPQSVLLLEELSRCLLQEPRVRRAHPSLCMHPAPQSLLTLMKWALLANFTPSNRHKAPRSRVSSLIKSHRCSSPDNSMIAAANGFCNRISLIDSFLKEFLFFGHTAWHVGSCFPSQESNPCPLQCKCVILTT